MRSPAEIAYRVRQEAANLKLWLAPPRLTADALAPLAGLPEPRCIAATLRGTPFAVELEQRAEEILHGRYRLLGLNLELEREPRWRKDPVSGVETGLPYFRRVPFLDASRVGDHKFVWELNRHQHLTLLAQAFVVCERKDFFEELLRQWESWVDQNPFQRGINWASALEVSIRALAWIWIYHLTGDRMTALQRRRFLEELYWHGRHLEINLSVYFSPNTHLLGEAVALHCLGTLLPVLPRSARWAELGGRVVRNELRRQVQADGAHFEQSVYYHVYALDLFLLHYILDRRGQELHRILELMAEYLDATIGPQCRLPLIGDDDGGRLFFPCVLPEHYGRATLATCGQLLGRPEWAKDPGDAQRQAIWWLGPATQAESLQTAGRGAKRMRDSGEVIARGEFVVRESLEGHVRGVNETRLFSDSGTVVWSRGEFWVLIQAGGFGALRAGHSHSHALSVIARLGDEDLLIDPGTFTYTGEPRWRRWFRSSAAHNTVRVNGLDQAPQSGPFSWTGKPAVAIELWQPSPREPRLAACCRYHGAEVRHRRYFALSGEDVLFVLDEIRGPRRATCEQFWHPGGAVQQLSERAFRIGSRAQLVLTHPASLEEGGENSWRSRAYGQKESAPAILAALQAETPVFLGAALVATSDAEAVDFAMVTETGQVGFKLTGRLRREIWFNLIHD
ncbi:MAG TPA: alginate lyase family protein [Bryobacteraceae bacterium]